MRSAIGTSSPAFGMPIPDVDKARTACEHLLVSSIIKSCDLGHCSAPPHG